MGACRTARVGLAWVTAFMTLVTATPHFACRCPTGHVKPFCLALTSKTSRCCCAGACCSQAGGGCCCRERRGNYPAPLAANEPCCGGRTPAWLKGKPLPGCSRLAHPGGCVKTL